VRIPAFVVARTDAGVAWRDRGSRGIDLNELVDHDFIIGRVRCRAMRLCERCTVIQRYAGRPIIRPLVHRGGIRADILTAGEIHPGDHVVARS
jgi:hypothetical protein